MVSIMIPSDRTANEWFKRVLTQLIVRVKSENLWILRRVEAFFSRSCQTLVLPYFGYAESDSAV